MPLLWFQADARYLRASSRFDRVSLQKWGLSVRTLNALLGSNFKMTLGDVLRTHEQLPTIKGLGQEGIHELSLKMAHLLAEEQQNETDLSLHQPLPEYSENLINWPPKELPTSVRPVPFVNSDVKIPKSAEIKFPRTTDSQHQYWKHRPASHLVCDER